MDANVFVPFAMTFFTGSWVTCSDRIVLLSPAPMRVTEVIELPVGKPRDESLHDLRHVKGHILSVLERGDGVPA